MRLASTLCCASMVVAASGCVPPDDDHSATTFSSASAPTGDDATEPQVALAADTTSPDSESASTSEEKVASDNSDEPQEATQNTIAKTPREESDSAASSPDEPPPTTKPADTKVTPKNAKPAKVTFDNLVIGMQKDIKFRPFMMTEEAQSLVGQVIQIPGYMSGGVSKIEGLEEFILLRNTECKFGPGGQADHLIQIKMKAGKSTNYTKDMLYVQGTLEFKPFEGPDGNTWSIYEINDGAVVRGSRF